MAMPMQRKEYLGFVITVQPPAHLETVIGRVLPRATGDQIGKRWLPWARRRLKVTGQPESTREGYWTVALQTEVILAITYAPSGGLDQATVNSLLSQLGVLGAPRSGIATAVLPWPFRP